MKTKGKAARHPAPSEPAKSAPAPEPQNPEPAEPNDGSTRIGLAYYVDENGKVLFDKLRPSSREALRKAFLNEELRSHLGLASVKESSAAPQEIPAFGDEEANALLDGLQLVDSFAASLIYKVPREVTDEAFTFQAHHREKINPKLIRLLNKWGPLILKTWKDEIGFALVMGSTLNSQVRIMGILEARRRSNAAKNVTPMPQKETPGKPEAVPPAATGD